MLTPLVRRDLFLLVAMAGLVGCATPRYETVIHREMPADAPARACLEACQVGLDACKRDCTEQYQACLKRVGPEAEEHYRQTLDRYAAELERYRRDLANYESHLWLGWNWSHGGYWYGPWPYAWPYPYPLPPPPPPRPPGREADLSRFREARCGGDCGCQSPYDACFLACGGKITSEQRCVSHCPESR